MRLIRHKKESVDVNLTPLIDVVFLLLIFFMVSTTFSKETHLTLQLPDAQGNTEEMQPEMIEVVISADGEYAINGKALINKQLQTLMAGIAEVSQDNKDLPFVITADKSAAHHSVMQALDAGAQLGFNKVSLTAQNTKTAQP